MLCPFGLKGETTCKVPWFDLPNFLLKWIWLRRNMKSYYRKPQIQGSCWRIFMLNGSGYQISMTMHLLFAFRGKSEATAQKDHISNISMDYIPTRF